MAAGASLRRWLGTLAWCVLCTADGSFALAAGPALPGSSDAGRVQERLETPETPTVGQAPPVIEAMPETLPPVNPGEGFILRKVIIDGAKAFPADETQAVVKPYIGKHVNVAGLIFIAGKITDYYQSHGYLISKAVLPQQEVKDGVVHIAVIEGYVAKVRTEGAPGDDRLSIVGKTEQAIMAMRPLSGPGLDRYVQLLNDLGGVQVAAILEPLTGPNPPVGGVGMVLKFTAAAQPRSSLLVDNFGSRYSGPWEATATTQFYSVASAFDTLAVSGLLSKPVEETKYIAIDYSLPVDEEGTKAIAGASYAHSRPGFSLQQEDIGSDAEEWKLGVSHPFIRQRATTLTATAIFDWKDVAADILATDLYRDRIRALRVTGHLEHADALNGSSLLDVTGSQGINGLGATPNGSLDLSRAEGRSDFTKVDGTASRVQELGGSFQAFVSATGQYAWTPLLSSEEFGYGGQAFGRGYDPSEILGDDGAAASAELRYNGLPRWRDASFQPFAFYDVGKVWNIATGGKAMSGASFGSGVRLDVDGGISGQIYGAFPATRPSSDPPQGNGKTMRLLMQIGWRF